MISRSGVWRTEGFANYALDNGAWTDHQRGLSFDADAFERLIDRLGPGADWIVLPDIVAAGKASLDLSTRWLNRCRSACDLVLLPVQDGMEEADVRGMVGRNVGIFLGGSTPWKLARMASWGAFCHTHSLHYHVARVNTERRMAMAQAAGARSVDGSSVSRYAVTLPLLDRASRQRDLWAPTRDNPR